MLKKIINLLLIALISFSSINLAFAEETTETESDETKDTTSTETYQTGEYYTPRTGPSGTVIAGYVLTGIGGAAAITGTTIVAATDKDVEGAIIAGCGAAVGLAGSLMIMFGSYHYALAPTVDPQQGVYALSLSGDF